MTKTPGPCVWCGQPFASHPRGCPRAPRPVPGTALHPLVLTLIIVVLAVIGFWVIEALWTMRNCTEVLGTRICQ